MPLKVEKQGRESAQNITRRFTQKMRRSGILLEARKNRFFDRPKSKPLKKRSALRRATKRAEFAKLKKMGKAPDKYQSRNRR